MNRNEVLSSILEADEDFIEDILAAAMNRKKRLYPDWEIRYLALPRGTDREERNRYERVWQMLTERQ